MKKLALRATVLLMALLVLMSSAVCVSAHTATEPEDDGTSVASEEIETRDTYVWRYKTENGVLYKRKYNVTTQQWVGDWIKA